MGKQSAPNPHLATKRGTPVQIAYVFPKEKASISALMGEGLVLRLPPNAEIFRQGDPAISVVAVESGITKLLRCQPDGRESVIGLRSAGRILGGNSVLLAIPHESTAVTVTRCRIHSVAADSFLDALRRDTTFSWNLHLAQSRESHEQVAQLESLHSLSALERLVQFLSDILSEHPSEPCPDGRRIKLPLKFSEVAQIIAVTPPYLSELLEELERIGVLKRDRGWLSIRTNQMVDPAAL